MTFGHVNNIKASKYLNRFYPIELEHNDTNYRFSLNAPTKLNYGTIKLYHLILNILNFQFLLKVYNWIIRIVCVLADILFLVLNATFSNISTISWWPVLVVEEAEVPEENHRLWASNW